MRFLFVVSAVVFFHSEVVFFHCSHYKNFISYVNCFNECNDTPLCFSFHLFSLTSSNSLLSLVLICLEQFLFKHVHVSFYIPDVVAVLHAT